MAAARSKSADEAPPADGGGASTLAGGRGPTTPLRMLKRTVVQETVSKSVTERKESTKQVTDQATGVERRRDSHIETSTTEEVRSKRQEETVESYDGAPLAATSQPILVAQGQTTSPCVPEGADTVRKTTSPKHPVAIRVHDDDEDTLTVKVPEPPLAPAAVPSILRTTSSHEDSEHKPPHPHKLEFQEEELEYHRAPLVKPPADLAQRFANVESKQDEDDDEPAEPPPSRFNMRRKDSIAVAKLRMLRQQEEGTSANSEDEADEEAPDTQTAGSPDKKHPSFRPPTVIAIVNEQPEEESAADVPDPVEPKAPANETSAPPDQPPLAPDEGRAVVKSRTQIDSQVTSTEKQQVATYANEIVTTKDTDEVVKKTLSEVTTESACLPTGVLVPREESAPAIVATVVDDVSAHVKTPMDKQSKQSL